MTVIADQISRNSKLFDIDQILSLTDFIVDLKISAIVCLFMEQEVNN
ncbi:hypothetical protein LCGC14_0755280 [marine sediment metagenome]|uniref:Uncharacterized protein n=1 Tax=marine sediment metagenome TaxID=412755 RepID=A0A0F9T9T7_9ZZZZ